MTNRPVYVALTVALVALVVAGGAIAYTATSNSGRISDIQDSRYDGNLNACQIRNQEHRGIQRFIARVSRHPLTPQSIALLDHYFPILPDCTAYARARVNAK